MDHICSGEGSRDANACKNVFHSKWRHHLLFFVADLFSLVCASVQHCDNNVKLVSTGLG